MSDKNARIILYSILCIGYMGVWVWNAIIRIGTYPMACNTPYDASLVPLLLIVLGIPMFLGYMLGRVKNENS